MVNSAPQAFHRGGVTNVHKKDQECDFYRNPTILSRLIQNFRYKAAMQRLQKRGPAEAGVWVCTRRKTDQPKSPSATTSLTSSILAHAKEPYGYRQLPIHMACEALFRVADPVLRNELESLISLLVLAFPEGCSRRDHQNNLPLHSVIWYDATPETVSNLLIAYPMGVQEKDNNGKYTIAINEHRKGAHKEAVRKLLRQKEEFWETAGSEAHYRLKHREIPASDGTIASMSVVAASIKEDDDTIMSSDTFDFSVDPYHPKASRQHAGHVSALQWTQVEQRAMALESKLAESYEHTYSLNQELTEINLSKKLLQKKVDMLALDDAAKVTGILLSENESLQRQVSLLQQRLDEKEASEDADAIDGNLPKMLHVANQQAIHVQEREMVQMKQQLRDVKEAYAKLEKEKNTKILGLQKALKEIQISKNNRIRSLEAKLEELTSFVQKTSTHQVSMSLDDSKTDVSDTTTIASDDDSVYTDGSSTEPYILSQSKTEEEDSTDVDTVLLDAVRLNGGQELSPRLVEMWQLMCARSESMYRIDEQEEDITEERSDEIETPKKYLQSQQEARESLEVPVLGGIDSSRPRYDRDMSDLTMTLALSARWNTGSERPAYDRDISELSLPVLPLTRNGSHTSIGLEPVGGLPVRSSLRLPVCPEGGPAAFQ